MYCIVSKPWYVPCNGLENWMIRKSCDDAMRAMARNSYKPKHSFQAGAIL